MPISVKQILSYIPALAETELPTGVEREKASHLDRYLDSICACIDLLGHPPFFVRWRKEENVNDIFFEILAGDLLLGEDALKKKNEAADSWKWGALERLSYKLVDLYQNKHKDLPIPPRSGSGNAFPAAIEGLAQASSQKKIITHLESSSHSPSSSKETISLPMQREIPREISDRPKEKEKNLAAKEPSSRENKAEDIMRDFVAKDKAAHLPLCQIQNQTGVPAPIAQSEEVPEIPSSGISPLSESEKGDESMSEAAASVASSQVNASRAFSLLVNSDPTLGDSFEDDLMSRTESRSPVDLASVTPTWKRFNRRSIHTKSRLFSHVVNLRKNRAEDVARTFFSERDMLSSLWALKESLLKRSTVWQRPLTRDRHLLQVKEVFKKLSPLEKCELLRRGIYLIHGKRGDNVVDFLKKLFLESFLELDESEKEQIRSYVSEDERLGSLLGFTIES